MTFSLLKQTSLLLGADIQLTLTWTDEALLV
jgi:hypothetical protein